MADAGGDVDWGRSAVGRRWLDGDDLAGGRKDDVNRSAARALDLYADSAVLVVDDNHDNVIILERLLRRAGLRRVHGMTDPEAALDGLDEIDPQLVLLDLHMPRLDGFEFLRRVAARYGGAYFPVMVLTGDSSREATRRAFDLGARDVLTKPFDRTETVLRVRNLLETAGLYDLLRTHTYALEEQVGQYERAERDQMRVREVDRAAIEEVLTGGGVRMVFQPVIDLADDAVVAVEALARFGDGSVTPDRWLARAAAVDLDRTLELDAISRALEALVDLPAPVSVAVNASPSVLLDPALARLLMDHDCTRVVVELTEHVPVEDYESVRAAFAPLDERGARLAVDDAGAGYASFRHLLALRPSIVKLDMSLTRDIERDPVRRALAAALVAFTGDTGAELIAEGVETPGELEVLRSLGVRFAQGYHLGRPVALDEVLSAHRRLRAGQRPWAVERSTG